MIQSIKQMQQILVHFRDSNQELELKEWMESIRSFKINASYNISNYIGNFKDHDKEQFILSYENNWKLFFKNLVTWQNIDESVIGLESINKEIFLAWLCPELPKVFSWALSNNVLFLVTDTPSWLKPLVDANCTLNIRETGFLRELSLQLSVGRSVGVMLDNSYTSTSTIGVKFFGRNIQTPAGIFNLAINNSYSINFLAPREGKMAFIKKMEAINETPESIAFWYNQLLENEMRIQPAKWLNWWSVHFRENIAKDKT